MDIETFNEAIWNLDESTNLSHLFSEWLTIPEADRQALNASLIAEGYDRLPAGHRQRHLLLVMLAIAADSDHLHELVERIVTDPPIEWEQVAYALSPLFRSTSWDVDLVFPRLLEALSHPSVAAAALDVANYTVRQKMVDEHPASDRAAQLGELLAAVAGQLGKLAENPRAFGDSVKEIQAKLEEGVSLSVSLCDALGLIGDTRQIGKLNRALSVHHRRVQTEAAGALARLGDEHGKTKLIELAAEPSARLRVLAYAEELGLLDEVKEEFQTDEAIAAAKLAVWLAHPSQIGFPPQHVEVIHRRTQFWPSFTEPVDCALVRYTYELEKRTHSNIGITGPVTYALESDLNDLTIDDLYAIYAGWHAEHSDIFEVPAESWNPAQHRASHGLIKHLEHAGFESIEPLFLGIMLDEHCLVARGVRENQAAIVVTDGLEWYSQPTPAQRGLKPHDVWNIFKGKRMLRAFNTFDTEGTTLEG